MQKFNYTRYIFVDTSTLFCFIVIFKIYVYDVYVCVCVDLMVIQ